MLHMDRDCKQGGKSFATPAQAEVQTKLVVLKVEAMICLRELFVSTNALLAARQRKKILLVPKQRCIPFDPSREDEIAVAEHPCEFLDAAKKGASKSTKTATSSGQTHG